MRYRRYIPGIGSKVGREVMTTERGGVTGVLVILPTLARAWYCVRVEYVIRRPKGHACTGLASCINDLSKFVYLSLLLYCYCYFRPYAYIIYCYADEGLAAAAALLENNAQRKVLLHGSFLETIFFSLIIISSL